MFNAIKHESTHPDDPTMTIADAEIEGMYYRVWFHREGVDSTCHPVKSDLDCHHSYTYFSSRLSAVHNTNNQQYRSHRRIGS